MEKFTIEKERIRITMQSIEIGEDLCVIITGGDKPHIGCVTLSIPRPSLSNKNSISATTSVLNLVGHKDDEVARYVSQKLASSLNRNVAISCGIHIDNIEEEEIELIMKITEELTEMIINDLSYREDSHLEL